MVWDLETLSKFITKPRSVVNGSNMAFIGLRSPDDVANVIACLATPSPPTAPNIFPPSFISSGIGDPLAPQTIALAKALDQQGRPSTVSCSH